MSTGAVTCPQEIRARNRRSALRKVWQSPEWKAAKAAFLKNHPVCDWCEKPATLPHHVTDETYGTPEYLNLEAHCIPMCNMCHRLGGKRGLVICPVCRKHYMLPSSACCRYCTPSEEIRARSISHEQAKIKRAAVLRTYHRKYNRRNTHSCDWHGTGQRCGNPIRRDKICPHSSQNAADRCDPDWFMARKKAATP